MNCLLFKDVFSILNYTQCDKSNELESLLNHLYTCSSERNVFSFINLHIGFSHGPFSQEFPTKI